MDIYADPRDEDGKTFCETNLVIFSAYSYQVCPDFQSAVERGLYGWRWTCPNRGDKCQYRHALPKGFVLKNDVEAQQLQREKDELTTVEEKIEEERANL